MYIKLVRLATSIDLWSMIYRVVRRLTEFVRLPLSLHRVGPSGHSRQMPSPNGRETPIARWADRSCDIENVHIYVFQDMQHEYPVHFVPSNATSESHPLIYRCSFAPRLQRGVGQLVLAFDTTEP